MNNSPLSPVLPKNKMSFPLGLDGVVLQILQNHVGADSAIGRADLLRQIQPHQICKDSVMRLAIQALREAGHRIANSESGEGYFLTATEQEYKEWIVKYTSRAYTIIKAKIAMDRNHEGQIPLFEDVENG